MPDQKKNLTWAIYENDECVFEMEQGTRTWDVWAKDYETDEAFRRAVENELAALENMGERLGRGFTVMPIREKVDVNRYYTLGWRFQDGFVPAVRSQTAELVEDEPEQKPEPAEVAA